MAETHEATVLLVFKESEHHYLIYLDETKADEWRLAHPELTVVKLKGTLADPTPMPTWSHLARGWGTQR